MQMNRMSLGGILLSSALIMLYYSVNVYIEYKQIQQVKCHER